MENRLKSRYASPEEFRAYSGIDLASRLYGSDNGGSAAEEFMFRIEWRMATYLDAQFYRNVDMEFPHFTEYQKKHYKMALIEQGIYELRNGDISTDSGYDPQEGVKADRRTLDSLTIAPNAQRELILCGLWCRKLKPSRGGSWYGWGI